MYVEQYSDFNRAFKPIFDKYGGQPFNEGWFDRVQKSHAKLRNQIGGLTFEAEVELKDGQGPASKRKADPIIKEIKEVFPSLHDYLRMKYDGIPKLEELLLWPNMPLDNHRQPKTAKKVLELYDEYKRYYQYDYPQGKKKLAKLLSDLGIIWARSRTKGAKYNVLLTTKAEAFAQLGHYEVDEGSCYGQGGCRDHNKGFLGETENTFVVLIREKGKIIARFWGFASCKYEHYNVCNFYMAKGVQEGNIVGSLRGFFAALKDVPTDKIYIHEDLVSASENDQDEERVIYLNDYGSFTFSTDKDLKSKQTIKVKRELEVIGVCAKCRRELSEDAEDDTRDVDGITICEICSEDAQYCSISKEYTFEEVGRFWSEHGDSFDAKLSELNKSDKHFRCKCGEYMQKSVHGQNKECYQCNHKRLYTNNVYSF